MKGLYICKCYWSYSSTAEKLFPVLKYGMTNNIKTRMDYYNKNGTYKLLAFFPCNNFLEQREKLIQTQYNEYRISRSEHIIYESGLFKQLYKQIKAAVTCKITRTKNPLGAIGLLIQD